MLELKDSCTKAKMACDVDCKRSMTLSKTLQTYFNFC